MTIRRRPRRANSLKDLKRLLGGAEVAHGKSRRDRMLEHAALLSDTKAAARSNYFKIQILNLLPISASSSWRMTGCFISLRSDVGRLGTPCWMTGRLEVR